MVALAGICVTVLGIYRPASGTVHVFPGISNLSRLSLCILLFHNHTTRYVERKEYQAYNAISKHFPNQVLHVVIYA